MSAASLATGLARMMTQRDDDNRADQIDVEAILRTIPESRKICLDVCARST